MDMRAGIGSVWILAGSRRGDNNQLQALAEALGMPFETKILAYNGLRHVPAFRRDLLHVTKSSGAVIRPPWPDLVIGVGPNSPPVARYIRRRSGGRTRIVQIGDPRCPIRDLDLLITTPQYIRRKAPNILALPLPIGDPARSVAVTPDEELWLQSSPQAAKADRGRRIDAQMEDRRQGAGPGDRPASGKIRPRWRKRHRGHQSAHPGAHPAAS